MADNPANLLDQRSDKLIQTLKRGLSMLHERGEIYAGAITALQKGQVAAVDSLVQQITSNFSALFTSASIVVAALQEGRYTSADVSGPVLLSLQNGLSLSLDVSGPVGFSPAPVVMIGRKANTTDKAVGRVVNWSSDTGTLVVDIIASFGAAGPHTDCYVEVGLLSVLAESQILSLVQAAREQVAVDRAAVEADKLLVGGYKNTANFAASTATTAAGIAVEAAENAQVWNPANYSTTAQIAVALGEEATARANAITTLTASVAGQLSDQSAASRRKAIAMAIAL